MTHEELKKYIKADVETRYQIHKTGYFKLYPEDTEKDFHSFTLIHLKDQTEKLKNIQRGKDADEIKLYNAEIEVLEYINSISSNKAPQPINVNECRTKELIADIISSMDNKGWQYAFVSEYDYNLFTDLLTSYFEFKPYKLPDTTIQLKRGCKTKLAKALGDVQKELSPINTLSADTDFFRIIRSLSHFEKVTQGDLYKALTR